MSMEYHVDDLFDILTPTQFGFHVNKDGKIGFIKVLSLVLVCLDPI